MRRVAVLGFLLLSAALHLAAQDFFVAPHFPVGQFPWAAADFNHDGVADVVVIDPLANTLSVLLGKGDGTYRPGSVFMLGTCQCGLQVADFNNDGNMDIAVDQSVNAISILLGNGDGTFRFGNGATLDSPFTLQAFSFGDINGDGNLDLLIVSRNGGELGEISVALGKGDGSFAAPINYSTPGSLNFPIPGTYSQPSAIASGDFNHDHQSDVAVADANGNLDIFLGNGDGTLRTPISYLAEPQLVSVSVADLDGDGNLDLIYASHVPAYSAPFPPDYVGVQLGNGDGTFRPAANYFAGRFLNTTTVADLNGDAKPDVVVGGFNVGVLLGNGDGTLQSPVLYAPSATHISVADLNGDGKSDIAALNNNGASFLLNDGTGALLAARSYDVGTSSVTSGDFTSNGEIDLATADANGDVRILFGNPDGTFGTPYDPGITGADSIASGDLNNDGNLDLVVANSSLSLVNVYLGYGNGSFHSPTSTQTAFFPGSIVLGDINRDGKLDLVTANKFGLQYAVTAATVLIGDGDGGFSNQLQVSSPYLASFPLLYDLNQDGFLDLLLVGSTRGVELFNGKGDGAFPSSTFLNTGYWVPTYMAVGDFNSDKKLDIVTGGTCCTKNVSVLLNEGNGNFTSTDYTTNSGTAATAIADFNHHGDLDIAVGALDVLSGNGDGTFQSPVSYDISSSGVYYPSGSSNLTVFDFNHDGAPDLAIANSTTHTVTVLLNLHGATARMESSPEIIARDQQTTLIATLGPAFGQVMKPSGSVVFKDGNVDLGFAPLVGGVAQFKASLSTVGVHVISGLYSGDALYFPRPIPGINMEVINNAPTITTLVSSSNVLLVGQSVSFTATVSSPFGAPTGTVQFNDYGMILGNVLLTGSSAVFATSTLPVGPHLVAARYQGNSSSFAPSNSPAIAEIVQSPGQAAVVTSLSSNSNPVHFKQRVTFDCSVRSNAGTPAGAVMFYDGAVLLQSSILDAGGHAVLTSGPFSPGAHPITAVYVGNPSFSAGAFALTEYSSPRPR